MTEPTLIERLSDDHLLQVGFGFALVLIGAALALALAQRKPSERFISPLILVMLACAAGCVTGGFCLAVSGWYEIRTDQDIHTRMQLRMIAMFRKEQLLEMEPQNFQSSRYYLDLSKLSPAEGGIRGLSTEAIEAHRKERIARLELDAADNDRALKEYETTGSLYGVRLPWGRAIDIRYDWQNSVNPWFL